MSCQRKICLFSSIKIILENKVISNLIFSVIIIVNLKQTKKSGMIYLMNDKLYNQAD